MSSEPDRQEADEVPNERTSLRSQQSEHRRYDESLHSGIDRIDPLNCRTARIYRGVLTVVFALGLFWLALLSVDQLISIGVGSTQGSGFETFSVTLLAVANIGASLLFYRAPSPSDRTLNLICVALLIIDMLIISMVEQLRRRIGPLPLVISFGGATLACLLSSISDTVVQKAKVEEQERIIGHSSTRRSLLEWVNVVLSNSFRVLIVILYCLLSINLIFDAADSHTSLGSLVPIGSVPDRVNDGTVIHIACSPAGTEGPVAIIEAGETSGEEMHGWVQRARGLKAVCFWDRPGMGLSDNAQSPLAVEGVVSYLVAALEQERPDFHDEDLLLVSHGVGSLYSRVFASKVSSRVAGMMLVDALHEEKFYSDQTTFLGMKEFLRGVGSTFTLQKLTGVIRGLGSEERLFGLLQHTQPRVHKFLLQQQVSANRRSIIDIGLATDTLPADTPILVVSSSEMCQDKLWNRYQRLLLKLSDRVVAWKILEGPHNLWWNKKAEKELTSQLEAFISYVRR